MFICQQKQVSVLTSITTQRLLLLSFAKFQKALFSLKICAVYVLPFKCSSKQGSQLVSGPWVKIYFSNYYFQAQESTFTVETVLLHVHFCSPVGLRRCRSVVALSGLLLSGQSSHRTPHPLGGAAAAEAIRLELGWLTMGKCQSPRQQGPPTQPCGHTATERQTVSETH